MMIHQKNPPTNTSSEEKDDSNDRSSYASPGKLETDDIEVNDINNLQKTNFLEGCLHILQFFHCVHWEKYALFYIHFDILTRIKRLEILSVNSCRNIRQQTAKFHIKTSETIYRCRR